MKAALMVGMELEWLRDLVHELGAPQGCVRVMEDNSGCVALAHGSKDTAKSNHFRRTQSYVEDLVSRGILWLDDVPGIHNPSDIFTKPVEPTAQFCYLRDIIMGRTPVPYVSVGVEAVLNGDESFRGNELLQSVRNWQDGKFAERTPITCPYQISSST